MTDNVDPLEIVQEALKEAGQRYVETVRTMKSDVIMRPAVGPKLTRQERLNQYVTVRNDPAQVGGMFDELAAKYKLPEDKPIPRRLVDYLLRNEKEMSKDAEGLMEELGS